MPYHVITVDLFDQFSNIVQYCDIIFLAHFCKVTAKLEVCGVVWFVWEHDVREFLERVVKVEYLPRGDRHRSDPQLWWMQRKGTRDQPTPCYSHIWSTDGLGYTEAT